MLQSLQCAHSRKRVIEDIEDINDTQLVSGKAPCVGDYGPNTYADSDDNTYVIVEVDRGLWDAQKYYEEEDLRTHRPTGGQPGMAYMEEDKQWVPISLDLKAYMSAEVRKSKGSPLAVRGKTHFRYFKNLDTAEEISDYYSDDDITIKKVFLKANKRVIEDIIDAQSVTGQVPCVGDYDPIEI